MPQVPPTLKVGETLRRRKDGRPPTVIIGVSSSVRVYIIISIQAAKSFVPPSQRDFSEEESHIVNSRPHVAPTRRGVSSPQGLPPEAETLRFCDSSFLSVKSKKGQFSFIPQGLRLRRKTLRRKKSLSDAGGGLCGLTADHYYQ